MNTYHIPREHIIAIGDSPGDAPMLQKAGIGVATALAPDTVKEVADVVLDSPALDAVPAFLRQHFGL
jgi:hydroxymethylpyrimidine pyrophosphatase-like HAD family hydrolase